jgi:hypothetical protein
MRKYQELSSEDQAKAVEKMAELLIETIVVDDIVPECLEEFSEQIDSAIAKSERLETPWFLCEILWELIRNNASMSATVEEEAHRLAENAFYAEPNDVLIYL